MSNRKWTSTWAGGVCIVLLTLAAYWPAMRGGFIWDDDAYVTENRTLHDADGLRRIWFEVGATPQYYPIAFTTFWAERRVWGLNPAGFHLDNVLLQAVGALLLWQILLRLQVPGAWLAAAIFAVHPVGVESVAWITERKNVLSGVFYFAAALAYLRFVEVSDNPASNTRRWRFYAGALLLFVGAMLSKTVTCSLPAALLLVGWWKTGRLRRGDVLPLLPFFAVGVGSGLVTAWVEKHHVGAQGAEWSLTLAQRALIAGRALWFYAGKLVWPAPLTFIYPRWEVDPRSWWQWLFPFAAIAVVISLWLARRRVGRGPLVAVLFFAGTLFPALGFINVYPMRYSFVADHFQFLASVGLIALAAAGLSRLRLAGAAVTLLLLVPLTWHQGKVYRNVETLWRDTLTKNPGCWMAHNNLGLALMKDGDLDEAILHFDQARQLRPDDAEILANLGGALTFKKRYAEAITSCEAAVRANPDYVEARANLGNALAATGRMDEAIAQYESALQRKPDHAGLHKGLGTALMTKGKPEQALEHFREALRLRPDDAAAHDNLGSVLAMQGKLDEAIKQFEQSVRLNPGQPKARFNYGNALAMQRNLPGAVEQYREAVRLSPGYAAAHKNLGMALAQMGQAKEAEAQLREALRLDPTLIQAAQQLKALTEKQGSN